MTLLSLDNACTLENFDNNTKSIEQFSSCQTPVMPLPTDPPSPALTSTNYHWKNDFNVANNLTTGPFAGSKYSGLETDGTCQFSSINFGNNNQTNEYNTYHYDNKLLTNNETRNLVNTNLTVNTGGTKEMNFPKIPNQQQIQKEWSNPVPPELRKEYKAKLDTQEVTNDYPIEYTEEQVNPKVPVLERKGKKTIEKMHNKVDQPTAFWIILVIIFVLILLTVMFRNVS